MPDLLLLEELQEYLIAQGVGQLPSAAPSTALPSIWLDPREGAREPRTGEDATITLTQPDEVPRPWLEGKVLQELIVDVTVRARKSPQAILVQRGIRAKVEEAKNVFFGDLRIEWAKQWRGDTQIAADEVSHTRRQSFRIAARVKSLAGLPYAP